MCRQLAQNSDGLSVGISLLVVVTELCHPVTGEMPTWPDSSRHPQSAAIHDGSTGPAGKQNNAQSFRKTKGLEQSIYCCSRTGIVGMPIDGLFHVRCGHKSAYYSVVEYLGNEQK